MGVEHITKSSEFRPCLWDLVASDSALSSTLSHDHAVELAKCIWAEEAFRYPDYQSAEEFKHACEKNYSDCLSMYATFVPFVEEYFTYVMEDEDPYYEQDIDNEDEDERHRMKQCMCNIWHDDNVLDHLMERNFEELQDSAWFYNWRRHG